MTDIVQRLRFRGGTHVPIIDTMTEAADEIERLRTMLIALLKPHVKDDAELEQFLRKADDVERHALKTTARMLKR